MLDIYAIADCDQRWEEPKEELLLGSLSLKEHQALKGMLQELQLEDNGLSFFEDTRLRSSAVAVAARRAQELAIPLSSVFAKFLEMLQTAESQGMGLMSFSD